ncbi:MAG TPA: DUF3443 domain-containing protein [Paraburkholderia sp.]|jgi:hypothetical protein
MVRSLTRTKDWMKVVGAVVVVSLLAACGGGGGGSGSSQSGNAPAPNVPNSVAVTVDQGVSRFANIPTVSVTVCAPGTSTCQTIDHVLLDTKSFGLRLVAASLGSLASSLPGLPSGSGQLAQCTIFADGFTWGTIRTADVKIGGEQASGIPIQMVGDLPVATTPAQNCTDRTANSENTASDLGANGILGVGVAPIDCGAACAAPISAANPSTYFTCPAGTATNNCQRASAPVAQQVANPVARFASNNNGLVIQLPTVPDGGTASATGTLTFGVNTQANNTLPSSVTTFATDPAGDLDNSSFNGVNGVSAFFDTGSNGLFFTDGSLAQCGSEAPQFYCPATTQTRSATLKGQNSTSATVSFQVANADSLFNSGNFAFSNLAGQNGSATSLDLGLPFFYGRTVYQGLDLTSTGGNAPFIGF